MGKGKPRGLNAARKLRNHRREGQLLTFHNEPILLRNCQGFQPEADMDLFLNRTMGRSLIQEASPWNRLQVLTFRWFFTRQGHSLGKSWC